MTAFTLFQASLELATSIPAADRVHDSRPSLFLRVIDDDAEGWSECPAAVEPGVDPTADELVAALGALLEAADTGHAGVERGAVAGASRARHAVKVARSFLAAAYLDLGLRREQRSLTAALGVVASDVGFAGVIGIEAPSRARAHARELVELGASRLRVKVSPLVSTEALEAVLDATDVPVVADANGSFEPVTNQRELDALLALPLAWLEQPFAQDRLEHTAALASRTTVPIGLDESASSLEAIRESARLGAARVICLKPFRFGIPGALEARRVAASLGLRTYVGGYFEAGLGRSVLASLAALDDDLDGDVVAPCTYLTSDPCALPGPTAGRQPLHVTPGCGPIPTVERMAVRLERTASEPPTRRS
ncbi:MAG TPA: enolase C-terminal domain-like protein [Acidimicrobiales bacterium]|nr:enolase C-terminal domain-like protein [Acidimicrobiales bacterium]